jgi:hypothetical protein
MTKAIVLKNTDNREEFFDQQIAERVDLIRSIQERIGALNEKIQAAKEELSDLLTEKGSNWSDDEGYVRLVADSVRRSYDTKALDELIINDPLRHGWLKDYRKETPVRGGIQVK